MNNTVISKKLSLSGLNVVKATTAIVAPHNIIEFKRFYKGSEYPKILPSINICKPIKINNHWLENP